MAKYIGAHVSGAGGVHQAVLAAQQIGAKAFALFVQNQRQWHAPPLPQEIIHNFNKNLKDYNYNPKYILPHGSYLINLAQPDLEKLTQTRRAFISEAKRCAELGLTQINYHPGNPLDLISEKEGLSRIAESVNMALNTVNTVDIILENTAGQGRWLGYRFEHLAEILEQIDNNYKNRVGICLDTCHLFAAGYDLSEKNQDKFIDIFNDFDKIIGFKYLRAMHLNDSKSILNSRVDRHESLGQGHIGWAIFKFIMGDKRFDNIPLILETPDPLRWPDEIASLYNFI